MRFHLLLLAGFMLLPTTLLACEGQHKPYADSKAAILATNPTATFEVIDGAAGKILGYSLVSKSGNPDAIDISLVTKVVVVRSPRYKGNVIVGVFGDDPDMCGMGVTIIPETTLTALQGNPT